MFFVKRLVLFLLLFTCLDRMYMGELIVPTWTDEVLMLLYIGLNLFFAPSISFYASRVVKNTSIGYFVLLCYGIVLSIYHGIYQEAILYDVVDIFKLPIFFILFLVISCDKKTLDYTKWCYIILNIPSMAMGLIQWIFGKFFGIYLGVSIYRDRLLGVRINGMAGHNIAMGFAMMIMIIILLEKISETHRKNIKKTLLTILLIPAILCLLFTQSRLPIALITIYILYKYVYIRQTEVKRFLIIIVSAFLLLCFLLYNGNDDVDKYIQNEELTIRYKTIEKGINNLNEYPFLGYGLGSYGTPQSLNCSQLYINENTTLKQLIKRGGTREAFAFQILIELGIVGVLLFYIPFIMISTYGYRRKKFDLFLLMFLGFILQSIFNGIYQMPIFIYLCIFSSYTLKSEQLKKICEKKMSTP